MATPLITNRILDLARAPKYKIGTRFGLPKYFTLHYNGPHVKGFGNPDQEWEQIRFDAKYHIGKNWSNVPGIIVRGDGIMYHGYTDSAGRHYQLRDYGDVLYHCGSAEGNTKSISWHVPIGDQQRCTLKQEFALNELFDYFAGLWYIDPVNFKGHKDWKPTLCPGNAYVILTSWKLNHRHTYNTYVTTANLNVRQQPNDDLIHNPIAGQIPKGTTIYTDAISGNWLHLASEWGFVHKNYCVRRG